MEEQSVKATELIVSLWGAIAAGIMQICVILLLSFKLTKVQYVASFLISALFGGGIGIILQYKGTDPYLAGVISAFLGALPAVLVPMIITKQVLKKAGTSFDEINQMLGQIRKLDDPDQETAPEASMVPIPSKRDVDIVTSEAAVTRSIQEELASGDKNV